MTIKHIQARFTSGNDIPIDKAVVPASEWNAAMAEIESMRKDAARLDHVLKWDDQTGSVESRLTKPCKTS